MDYVYHLALCLGLLISSPEQIVSQDDSPVYDMCNATQPFSKRIFTLEAIFNRTSGDLQSQNPSCGCGIYRKGADPVIVVLTIRSFICSVNCSSSIVIYKDGCILREICCASGPTSEIIQLDEDEETEIYIGFTGQDITDTLNAALDVTVAAPSITALETSCGVAQPKTVCLTTTVPPTTQADATTLSPTTLPDPTTARSKTQTDATTIPSTLPTDPTIVSSHTLSDASAVPSNQETTGPRKPTASDDPPSLNPAAVTVPSHSMAETTAASGGLESRGTTSDENRLQPGLSTTGFSDLKTTSAGKMDETTGTGHLLNSGYTDTGLGVTAGVGVAEGMTTDSGGDGRPDLLLGPVIGGCVSGVVLIIILVIVCATCKYRREKRARSKKGSSVGTDHAPMTDLQPPDIGYGYAKSIPSQASSVISEAPVVRNGGVIVRNGDVLPDVTRGVDRGYPITIEPDPPYNTVGGERLPQEFYPGSMMELSTSRARQEPGRVQRSSSYREQPISASMGDFHFSLEPAPPRSRPGSEMGVRPGVVPPHRGASSEIGVSPGTSFDVAVSPHVYAQEVSDSPDTSNRGSHYAPASDISQNSNGSKSITGSITDIQVPPPRLQRFNSLGSDRSQGVSRRHPGYVQLEAYNQAARTNSNPRPARPHSVASPQPEAFQHYATLGDVRGEMPGPQPPVATHHRHTHSLDRREPPVVPRAESYRRESGRRPVPPVPAPAPPPPPPPHQGVPLLPPPQTTRAQRPRPPPPTSPPPSESPNLNPRNSHHSNPSPRHSSHSDINSNFVLRPKPHEVSSGGQARNNIPPPPPPPPLPASFTPPSAEKTEIIYAVPNLAAKRNSKRNSNLVGITESEWEQVVDEQFQFIDTDMYNELE